MKNINSIIIFRALQLGDLLCAVPAFRALRHAYPDAHIAIAGLPWMQSFVERFSKYINEFIWFPGYPGLPEQEINAAATADFLKKMIDRKFDLALQMQGNGSIVNPLIELFGARLTAGFYTDDHYYPDNGLFIKYPEGISEIHRHLKLMEHLGMKPQGDDLEFPVTSKDNEELKQAAINVEGNKFICVHPGSRGAYRRWPTAYFARLADECADSGYEIIVTGTTDELPIVEEVASKMKHKPVIAAGKTNIGSMAALLKLSGGLISNCTGVSHIASGLKIKSVVISMDGEPERWGPLNKNTHITIDWTKYPDFSGVEQAVKKQFLIS